MFCKYYNFSFRFRNLNIAFLFDKLILNRIWRMEKEKDPETLSAIQRFHDNSPRKKSKRMSSPLMVH